MTYHMTSDNGLKTVRGRVTCLHTAVIKQSVVEGVSYQSHVKPVMRVTSHHVTDQLHVTRLTTIPPSNETSQK